MKRQILGLVLFGAAQGWSGAAVAQTQRDTVRLADITVTATGVPVNADAVTATLTVLDGDELRTRGIPTVLEALRTVPGLDVVQTGSFGANTALFLRGGESNYVKVLIDGVPVNSPGGAFNFANLTTTNVDRIEILRGPASVLYGSDATSGVVHIITKRGAGRATGSVALRGGTYGTVDLSGEASGGTATTSYSLGITRRTSDGAYAFNNDYGNTALTGRFAVHPDDLTDLDITLRYHDTKFNFPTDGSGNLVDRNAFALDEATTVGINASRFLGEHVEARLRVASNVATLGSDDSQDDAADTLGFFAFRSITDVSRQSVDARANVFLDKGVTVTVGAELEQQEERSFNESESEFGPSNGSSNEERSNRAYYTQLLGDLGALSFAIGGRLDDNDAFGTFATYRVGASYRVASGTKGRVSVGSSFKAPTFFENFATGFAIGNPDLEPERSSAWEVGLEQRIADGRVVIRGTYFDQSFQDLIQFSFTDTPNFLNVTAADASGVELEVVVQPIPALSVGAAYTYLDTEVTDPGFDTGLGGEFVAGQRLLRRPTRTFSARTRYRLNDRAVFGVVVNHVGDRDDRNFSTFPAEPVVLDPYTTVELSGEAVVIRGSDSRPALVATARIENALQQAYVEVLGFPARGRTLLVGASVRR